MSQGTDTAPGAPGDPPSWSSSRKAAVGTARNLRSHIWFTIGDGILNEIYFPRIDCAATRDFRFAVTDGHNFLSDERRDTTHEVSWMASGVPAFEIANSCRQGRYRLRKRVLADPERHVILLHVSFTPLKGRPEDYRLYALLRPHLRNQGANNTAFLGSYKGIPMLFARHQNIAVAAACSVGWAKRSVGFVGVSDGWQQLTQHKDFINEYRRARNGNVALTGEIALDRGNCEFLVALAFGHNAREAAHRARSTLNRGFEKAWQEYRREWEDWHRSLLDLEEAHSSGGRHYRLSLAALASHEAKDFPGAIIASLCVPWGRVHGDADPWGYHVVWPRDSCECSGGLLAAGAKEEVRRALEYFQTTQEPDGHWPQNMWLNGHHAWNGMQIDEIAAPILLLDLARRNDVFAKDNEVARFWPMVRSAIACIARSGPASDQDRWEEDPGYSPYTLGAEIGAMLIAADMAEEFGEHRLGQYLRETADAWNDSIEDWIYATGTQLAKQVGVDGYYVRIAPPGRNGSHDLRREIVTIKNREPGKNSMPAADVVSPDALALVRFGLRSARDPRIRNTIKVIDATLKSDTPHGPCWHRYTSDGYGEHADGEPFDGTGIGRAWPILTGERAHYELAAGNIEAARDLARTLQQFGDETGLIPEQVWESADIPEKELWLGKPTRSARPLVWAHSEYIKVLRSLRDGKVFDMPPQTYERYVEGKVEARHSIWSFTDQLHSIKAGRVLRLQTNAPARVRWSADGWSTHADIEATDTHLGIWYVDLPPQKAPREFLFTFFWPEVKRWEGKNFSVRIEGHPEKPAGKYAPRRKSAERELAGVRPFKLQAEARPRKVRVQ